MSELEKNTETETTPKGSTTASCSPWHTFECSNPVWGTDFENMPDQIVIPRIGTDLNGWDYAPRTSLKHGELWLSVLEAEMLEEHYGYIPDTIQNHAF